MTLFATCWTWVCAALVAFLLTACGKPLQHPEQSGELVVLTRVSPTTYFIGVDGKESGFEYDLFKLFAERQGWRLKIKPALSITGLIARLRNGEAHLAAAGLSVTADRSQVFDFGPTYTETREIVVCGPGKLPTNLNELIGMRLEVVADSSHVERLKVLQRSVPALTWHEVQAPSEEKLLERVALGSTDCAVADSVSFDVAWNFLPALREAFEIGVVSDVAWMLPKIKDQSNASLRAALQDFFKKIEASGELAQLKERYFGHVRHLAEADVRGILEKRTQLLPSLKSAFYQAEDETGLDWRFLAALAYQESQWDAMAVSPTGVRGIMMLTGTTADHLGVKNRLDSTESILGGARYMVMLRDNLPMEIQEPDRTWLALAAYNVGEGHIEDARTLARRLGKDPDLWRDMKEVLPLIARGKYLSMLRHGYARGGEARALVENVRIYYDILARYEPPLYRLGLGSSKESNFTEQQTQGASLGPVPVP